MIGIWTALRHVVYTSQQETNDFRSDIDLYHTQEVTSIQISVWFQQHWFRNEGDDPNHVKEALAGMSMV